MRNISDNNVERIKHLFFKNNFFPKIVLSVRHCGKTQQALLRFHFKYGYANVPQCYVIWTLT